MLHVTTQVGVPGKQEREKRHFPELTNTRCTPAYKARGRRYIPHGYGDDVHFRPHPQSLIPQYTEHGPDWKSRIRPIPSPHNDDYPAEENWPEPWRPLRTCPGQTSEISYCIDGSNQRTVREWALYFEGPGYDSTLRSKWNGVHMASRRSDAEISHSMRFGKGRIVIDRRNGMATASPGDKSYQAVEYSPEFHKRGSTRPVVNFGGNAKKKADTFVPLIDLPPSPRETFAMRERARRLHENMEEVAELEKWRPASSLTVPPSNIHGQGHHAHAATAEAK